VQCQGWRNTESIGSVHCLKLLRFELTLGYHPARRAATVAATAPLHSISTGVASLQTAP
jgi:hypothetical protein